MASKSSYSNIILERNGNKYLMIIFFILDRAENFKIVQNLFLTQQENPTYSYKESKFVGPSGAVQTVSSKAP
jgi:hypothetical protein